jgi:hypothetical protein
VCNVGSGEAISSQQDRLRRASGALPALSPLPSLSAVRPVSALSAVSRVAALPALSAWPGNAVRRGTGVVELQQKLVELGNSPAKFQQLVKLQPHGSSEYSNSLKTHGRAWTFLNRIGKLHSFRYKRGR